MRSLGAGEACERLAEIVDDAAHGAMRTVLLDQHGPVAAVVPIADLELLETLENLIDVHEASAALTETRQSGSKPLAALLAELEAHGKP